MAQNPLDDMKKPDLINLAQKEDIYLPSGITPLEI